MASAYPSPPSYHTYTATAPPVYGAVSTPGEPLIAVTIQEGNSKKSCSNNNNSKCCTPVDSPIFLLDKDEYFGENDLKFTKGLMNCSNAMYRKCYKFALVMSLIFSFIFIPFIGLFAGCFDAFITLGVRPWARPVGKLVSESLGFMHSKYFLYRDPKYQV